MTISMKKTGLAAAAATALLAIASPAFAQDAGVPAETQFILNSFSFLFSGAVVMFMAAGFAMLESGLVRTKNVTTILLKNIGLFSIAGIMYYLIGYNLMYMDVSGWIGSLSLWAQMTPLPLVATSLAVIPQRLTGSSRWSSLPPQLRSFRYCCRAYQTVAVPDLRRCSDWRPVSDHRFLDLGRRLARRDGLL